MNSSIEIIKDRSVWQPEDLRQETDWKYFFSENDVKEIDEALSFVKSKSYTLSDINIDNFQLHDIAKELRKVESYVEEDRGVFILKGLPVDKYSHEDLKIVYMGIGVQFGYPLRQSLKGELLQDVYNQGENLYGNTGRGTNSSDRLPWHTDRCDIVSLLCISQSASGGESKLASLTNVYNKIKQERPELAEILCSPYFHGRAPFEKDNLSPYYTLPVFTSYQGKFASRYLRRFIEISQEIEGVPKFSALQIEALDYLDKRLEDSDVCLDIPFDKGDIQIVNNFCICHSRNSYVDTPSQQRKLMRLWLAAYQGRDLSPEFSPLYGETKGGKVRGGILFN